MKRCHAVCQCLLHGSALPLPGIHGHYSAIIKQISAGQLGGQHYTGCERGLPRMCHALGSQLRCATALVWLHMPCSWWQLLGGWLVAAGVLPRMPLVAHVTNMLRRTLSQRKVGIAAFMAQRPRAPGHIPELQAQHVGSCKRRAHVVENSHSTMSMIQYAWGRCIHSLGSALPLIAVWGPVTLSPLPASIGSNYSEARRGAYAHMRLRPARD